MLAKQSISSPATGRARRSALWLSEDVLLRTELAGRADRDTHAPGRRPLQPQDLA